MAKIQSMNVIKQQPSTSFKSNDNQRGNAAPRNDRTPIASDVEWDDEDQYSFNQRSSSKPTNYMVPSKKTSGIGGVLGTGLKNSKNFSILLKTS